MLKFDGNDNPEFPKAIGKGEKVARKNTPQQEDEIKKNFAGLENLDYDEIHPNEKWVEDNVVGSSQTGNNPEWANAEKTDLGEKLAQKLKDKKFRKAKEMAYKNIISKTGILKQAQVVTTDPKFVGEQIAKIILIMIAKFSIVEKFVKRKCWLTFQWFSK